MTLWIALPAYNEAPRLPALLDRWSAVMKTMNRPHRYVIIDDGSSDDTPDILRKFAVEHPLETITHRPNQGLGASLRDGLRHVADNGDDGDVVVMMDADNTQPPELLPVMLERMSATRCDVVIASRYRCGAEVIGLSALRRFMSFGARVLFQTVFPIRGVRDYTCGYRLYRVALIQRAFAVYGNRFCERNGFECAADILLRLAKLGATFEEVGMVLQYGTKEGDSSMRVARTVRKTLELMLTRRFERAPHQARSSLPTTSTPVCHPQSTPVSHSESAPVSHSESAPVCHSESAPVSHSESAPVCHSERSEESR